MARRVVVIAASSGDIEALQAVLGLLPADFDAPILMVEGGIAIVEGPADALGDDVPVSDPACVDADLVAPVAEFGSLLARLVEEPVGADPGGATDHARPELVDRAHGPLSGAPASFAQSGRPSKPARELDDLRAALATRDLIWEAKLIIAAATGCDAEKAHQLLVQQSQHENRKLRDIAAEMVARTRE